MLLWPLSLKYADQIMLGSAKNISNTTTSAKARHASRSNLYFTLPTLAIVVKKCDDTAAGVARSAE
jgi:uncharacterized membrane protein